MTLMVHSCGYFASRSDSRPMNSTLRWPRGTPENRPMRDTSKAANGRMAGQRLLYLASGGAGKSFWQIFLATLIGTAYTGSTWAEDTAPQGCDRSAVPGAGMAWAAQAAPLRSHSGFNALNPGSARAAPSLLINALLFLVGCGGLGAPTPRAAFQHMAMMQ